jgi:hypothetical protein
MVKAILTDEEVETIQKGLFSLMTSPGTNSSVREAATNLSDWLRAENAGHFSDWNDAEGDFVQAGIDAREDSKSDLANDPIEW